MVTTRRIFLILAARIVGWFSTTFNIGAGGTWPGEFALRFDPHILSNLASQLSYIVLIAGTNGKTTTVKMIETIIRTKNRELRIKNDNDKEIRVVHNATGANLLNGITSALVQSTDLFGNLKGNIGIFEVDEAVLPLALKEFTPQVVVLLNLFRDQLDRYGEVDLVAEKWLHALKRLPKSSVVFINADDPHLAFIGSQLEAKVKYFGLSNKKYFLKNIPHAVDTIFCPQCGKRLSFAGVYLSHLGEWRCEYCGLGHPPNNISLAEIPSTLIGVYNIYNTLAASLVAEELGVKEDSIKKALTNFVPAFGRQEEFVIGGKTIKVFLAKNPAGFNVSLRTVLDTKPKVLLLVLNDRIPDGRDVSWIWDVDFETIPKGVSVIASGDRAYDIGLRLKYVKKGQKVKGKRQKYRQRLKIYPDLKKAIQAGLAEIKRGETLYILPTYTAMLEVRKILGGRKIL